MPFDAFLKIAGIPGESTDAQHPNEIEILSFSWGESSPETVGGGSGGGPGKVSMQDFRFVMNTNVASPDLFEACAAAEHMAEAILTVRRRSGQKIEYLKWELKEVVVASFTHAGEAEGSDKPVEEVALNFGQIFFNYQRVSANDEIVGPPIRRGFDRVANVKL
jgi:type VI secretion system secreted protein Hcp